MLTRPASQVFLGSEQYPYKGVLDTVAKCAHPLPPRSLLLLLTLVLSQPELRRGHERLDGVRLSSAHAFVNKKPDPYIAPCRTTDTTYTIATAGEEGFLSILPVYVDHILYPAITSAGFTTEVYCVNGKGEDAGVVRVLLLALVPLRLTLLSPPAGLLRDERSREWQW